MSEGLRAILNDDGVFEEYDDTYDLIIHCENKEEQEDVLNRLNWRWIPISERLPEIHNYSDIYLVTLKRDGIHIAMFTECDGKHWWTYDDVEAWMPLPKPYEVGSEDKE